MSQLPQVWSYDQQPVRRVLIDGQPWFVAKDVCEVLELANVGQALTRLDDDEKNTIILNDGTPGNPNMALVNEAGLYTLILSSRKPEAKQFKRWVTHEVIPAIRRSGTYSVGIPQTFAEALRLAADQQERLEEQQRLLEAAKPKVEFFDQVASSKDAIPIGHAAKVLGLKGIGRNRLFQLLRERKVLLSDNMPYQEYIDRGYFRVIEQKWTTPSGEKRISFKTLVYQKGLDFVRKLLA